MEDINLKNRKVFIAVIILLLLVSSVFLYLFISANEDKEFLQENIDRQFSYNLQSLHNYLYRSSSVDMDADSLALYHANIAKNAAVCEALFSISSYADNNALQNIMWTLIQMTPPDAYYLRITDKELIDDIGYLILHLNYQDNEELANDAWDKLVKQLQRTDN